jgi:hypothetical protein
MDRRRAPARRGDRRTRGGILRTALSSYTSAWVAAGIICMGAALLVLRIGRGRAGRTAADPEMAVSA